MLHGLRISDIKALTFNKIQNGYLIFRQKKTNSPERMKISKNAIEIIEKQKEVRDKKVFNLPTSPTIGRKILKWVKKAGIDKHYYLSLCQAYLCNYVLDI